MELNNNITDTTQNMLLLNAIGVVSGNMSSKLSKKKISFMLQKPKVKERIKCPQYMLKDIWQEGEVSL